MILYIKPSFEGITVYKNKDRIIFKGSIQKYLNVLLTPWLTTFKGRVEYLKKQSGFKRNIPWYIDHKTCFITTENIRTLEGEILNVCAIYKIEATHKNQTKIIFTNLESIVINKKFSTVKNRVAKAQQLCKDVKNNFE